MKLNNKKEIIGGIYTDVSERFQRGVLKDLSRALKANCHDAGVVEINRLGNIYGEDKGTGYAGNVWDKEGLCPTLTTMGGGNREPMIVEDFYKNREPRVYDETAPTIRAEREGLKVIEEKIIIGSLQKNAAIKTDGICTTLTEAMGKGGGQTPMIVASRGRNPDNPSDRKQGIELEQRLEPNSEGICNTLTSVQKDNLVLEPSILTPKRTEYGKAVRKDYENGKIQESRHNMTELQPRKDGVSNTLTTVQKDNLVLEPKIIIDDTQGFDGTRVYEDMCPTLRSQRSGLMTVEPVLHKIGNIYDSKGQNGNIYSNTGISPTISSGTTENKNNGGIGSSNAPKVIVASRGRNPQNASDRTSGNHVEQRLEPNSEGICNTLTSVQKDNLVLERDKTYLENAIEQIIEKNNGEIPDAWDLYNKNPITNGISKTLGAHCGQTGTAGATAITHNNRIRKLTPLECWRLMAFTDEDFHKAEQVNSNTQLYRQSGNSIVVNVLEAIFRNLNIQGIERWEELK